MALALDSDLISRVIMLTFGAMDSGGPYWCYVAVKPSRYEEFQRVIATKRYNIQKFPEDDYGEVIVSGEGIAPPSEVTRQVAGIFGVSLPELFGNMNPVAIIHDKIENMKRQQNEAT